MTEQYVKFNQTLMGHLNPSSSWEQPAVTTVNPTEPMETITNSGAGALIVQVTLARGTIPVEGALVIVSDVPNGNEISRQYTDNSGKTERLTLPAPDSSLSQTPNSSVRPYSIYNIRVEMPGYYPEQLNNVPIFDRILSVQPVALIPFVEGEVSPGEVNITETPSGNL